MESGLEGISCFVEVFLQEWTESLSELERPHE